MSDLKEVELGFRAGELQVFSSGSGYEEMLSKKYAMEESISHGYVPTTEEEEWLFFANEKLEDWATDIESVF